MPRGDGMENDLRFSDRDDDADEMDYGGGGASYEDDDEENGGWALDKQDEGLWDEPETGDDDEEEPGEAVASDEEDEDDSEGFAPVTPRRPGRPRAERPAPAVGTGTESASTPTIAEAPGGGV